MALINCPECGKEISNKAAACPNCGNPMSKQNVTAPTVASSDKHLHCPKCNSINLHIDQKGFSGGRALAGAVAVGGIGLLAGTIGSRNVDVTCLNCGHRFNPVKNLKKEKERIASEEMWRENPAGVIVIAVCLSLSMFLLFVPGVSIWWSVVSFVSGIIIPLFTGKSEHGYTDTVKSSGNKNPYDFNDQLRLTIEREGIIAGVQFFKLKTGYDLSLSKKKVEEFIHEYQITPRK